MDWFGGIEPYWLWLSLGLLLAALEMAVSGVYLIWIAVAALVTGALTWAFGISFPLQIIDFVAVALIAVFSARRALHDNPIREADPTLNKPTLRLIGQTAVVTDPIAHGSGRVHHGDSDWPVRGPDCATGTRVRITGADGSTLLVEPIVIDLQPSGGPR